MTDLLLDECYSCVISSLVLIKSLASQKNDEANAIIGVAAELGQNCIACIRSYEAGSVLPATEERLAEEIERMMETLKKSSLNSSESAACCTACETFIRNYRPVA